MLGAYLRKSFQAIAYRVRFAPLEKIHPNVVTLFSLLPAVAASFFIMRGQYAVAALLVLISLACDIIDGALSRQCFKETRFGDYLDAMVDRYREILIYAGFAAAGYAWQAFFALSGTLAISFAKARVALSVPTDDHDWPAVGDMADRSFLVVIGLLTAAMKPVWFGCLRTTSVFLVIIGIVTHVGTLFRMLYAKKLIFGKAPITGSEDKNN